MVGLRDSVQGWPATAATCRSNLGAPTHASFYKWFDRVLRVATSGSVGRVWFALLDSLV
jgi:hypothetical protein